MGGSSLIFYLVYLLKNLVVLGAHAVNIQVYKHANFTGLVWESSSNGGCNNILQDKQTDVHSIRTDTCFIAYADMDCKSVWTAKFLPGEIILLVNQIGRWGWIESFQTCNEEEGGNQLNLDIKNAEYFVITHDVLESYRNVCSCVNVPKYVQNMSQWSIDNHHNDLLAYYDPDCSEINPWSPEFIAAGHNDNSRNIGNRKTDSFTNATYKIQSLGPDHNSTYFQTSCNSTLAINPSTDQFERTTKRVMDITHDQNIFQSEALMNSLRKVWSYSKKGETSLPKSNWNCMSCFDY